MKLKILFVLFSFLFFSCATNQKLEKTVEAENFVDEQIKAEHQQDQTELLSELTLPEAKVPQQKLPEPESLTLVFAGDIMAHAVNYQKGNFDNIWRDVAPLLRSGDLTFGNIEAPVADSLEWSTYPAFNMHKSYVEAAIRAGFNTFSLANNHTNDQLLEGMKQTRKYFSERSDVWACGVKEKPTDSMTFHLIEKNGWKILFVAFTEILNRLDYSSYIDYFPSSEKKRADLKSQIQQIRSENPSDLFVISVHTDEPEYILKITDSHKKFFAELIEECGADVIWANHPHVVKCWEKTDKAFIMYANGNTISGQRTNPRFDAPETARDNTGDGLVIRLTFEKTYISETEFNISLKNNENFFITTYINPRSQFVIKMLDDDFISALDKSDMFDWAKYMSDRKKIMENNNKEIKWQ